MRLTNKKLDKKTNIPTSEFGFIAAIMLAIIAASSLLPALRALRVEPGRILNKE